MPKCCVEGCTDQSKDLRYFNFPTSRLLRRKWIAAIDPDLKPKLSTMVCSRHFLPSDLETARGRMRLRAMAVPSLDNKIQHKEDTNSSEASSISQKVDSPHIDSPPVDSPKLESPENDGPKVVSPKVGSQSNSSDTDSEVSDTEDEPEKNETNIITKVEVTETKVEVRSNVQEKRKNLHDKLKDLQQKRDRINNKIKKFEHEKERELKQEGSGDERVQEREVEGETGTEKSNGQTEGGEENGVGSAPKLPDGPRDIDKADPEDIEELLTNYQIKQDRPLNIHTVTEEPPEPDPEMAPEPEEKEPVYIEISVDKDKDNVTDKDDCLMVMESVQVELDPSELLLHERDAAPERDGDIDAVEIDDAPPGKEDPISLLTSSDEDDVIIEEPHIDTVEVSDETDEDDMPLGKLLRRRDRRRGRQLNSAPVPAFDPTQVNGETDIAKILWGMYEYYCVQCHYTTSSGSEYRKHTASHAKVLMMCQICGYMTASESQFTKHEKQHGEKKYKCHLCSYKAKHNMSLLYHLKGHKAEDFLKKTEVKNMLKRLPKSRLFECTNCSYTSKKRCDLKRHMTRRHKQDDEEFIP